MSPEQRTGKPHSAVVCPLAPELVGVGQGRAQTWLGLRSGEWQEAGWETFRGSGKHFAFISEIKPAESK